MPYLLKPASQSGGGAPAWPTHAAVVVGLIALVWIADVVGRQLLAPPFIGTWVWRNEYPAFDPKDWPAGWHDTVAFATLTFNGGPESGGGSLTAHLKLPAQSTAATAGGSQSDRPVVQKAAIKWSRAVARASNQYDRTGIYIEPRSQDRVAEPLARFFDGNDFEQWTIGSDGKTLYLQRGQGRLDFERPTAASGARSAAVGLQGAAGVMLLAVPAAALCLPLSALRRRTTNLMLAGYALLGVSELGGAYAAAHGMAHALALRTASLVAVIMLFLGWRARRAIP